MRLFFSHQDFVVLLDYMAWLGFDEKGIAGRSEVVAGLIVEEGA